MSKLLFTIFFFFSFSPFLYFPFFPFLFSPSSPSYPFTLTSFLSIHRFAFDLPPCTARSRFLQPSAPHLLLESASPAPPRWHLCSASSRLACLAPPRPARRLRPCLLMPTGPYTGGKAVKGEAELDGATFSWLRLPSGSRLRLHHQLHTRSRSGAARLAKLRLEPEFELLLEPCQTESQSISQTLWGCLAVCIRPIQACVVQLAGDR
jgi:hypothetical protein